MLCAIAATLGCERQAAPSADEAGRPEPTSVSLRVLVVNDAGLTKAIERQRGEWQAVSGDSFTVEAASWDSVTSGEPVAADIVVFATRHLGTLCEGGGLRPVRESILSGEEYDASDVFPVVQDKLVRYGGRTMALPLGVQAPLLCYRADLVKSPPTDWTGYGTAARSLADRQLPGAEPLRDWGAYLLLARAAPLAVHMHHEAVLFDLETMQAQIAAPPFERALELLTEVHQDAQISDGSCALVRDGQAGMAITFGPYGGNSEPAEESTDAASQGTINWAELPGSGEVFHPSVKQWETLPRGVRQVPLVGMGGRLAGVTQSSRNAAGAFRLLSWLTSSDVGGRLGSAGSASMPSRASQLAAAEPWFGPQLNQAERAQLGELTKSVFSHNSSLVVPRIPGIDEYLGALEEAVASAVGESLAPAEALQQAAEAWESITDRLGREKQGQAYRRHLNLSD